MDERARQFLEGHHAAAMVTLKPDGTPHVARVGVALVDGRLWSSGTRSRVRTANLRRDPRSTLFVYDPNDPSNAWRWLAVEATVRILDGPDAPEMHLRLFRVMQDGMPHPPGTLLWEGKETSEDEFRRIMADEGRLIYEFDVARAYGMY